MKFVFYLVILFSIHAAGAEFHSFSIYGHNNKHVGGMTVQDYNKDTIRTIRIESQFYLKKIFHRNHYSYSWSVVYRNGQLFSSDILVYKNASLQSTCSLKKKGSEYIFNKDGISSKYSSMAMAESELFFREPLNQSEVFSEFEGGKRKITKKKNSTYEVEGPKNSVLLNEYRYENGLLQSATFYHELIPFYLKRDK